MTTNANEIQRLSDRKLRAKEKEARKRLDTLARQPDPGKGLPAEAARLARDEIIAAAKQARDEATAFQAELAQRQAAEPKLTLSQRLEGAPGVHQRLAAATERAEKAEAERAAFHAMLKREQDEKHAAALEAKRKAGLVWEPVAEGGGDAVAAVFSSGYAWESVTKEIKDGKLEEPKLDLRLISHLWWALNLIEASGGAASIPTPEAGRMPPHWPAIDTEHHEGIRCRMSDLAHLESNGYLEIERNGATVTLRHGPRTLALVRTFREHWAAAK